MMYYSLRLAFREFKTYGDNPLIIDTTRTQVYANRTGSVGLGTTLPHGSHFTFVSLFHSSYLLNVQEVVLE